MTALKICFTPEQLEIAARLDAKVQGLVNKGCAGLWRKIGCQTAVRTSVLGWQVREVSTAN